MPAKTVRRSKDAVWGLAEAFKMLATPIRLRLMELLAQRGEVHVAELCKRLKLGQPTVSHHLGRMRARGLLLTRRDGKRTYYIVNRGAFDEPARFVRDLSSARRPAKRG